MTQILWRKYYGGVFEMEIYDMMSMGFFTHASQTLFHAGTTHPQLCSFFQMKMSEDSINGIYDTLKCCALISKVSLEFWMTMFALITSYD